MITNYKIRKSHDIKNDNEVICFDYIKKMAGDYSAISLESHYDDRSQGYADVFFKLINSLGFTDVESSLAYYCELDCLQDDNRIIRHKGFWNLKSHSEINYNFLSNKFEIIAEVNGKLKLSGFAILSSYEANELIKYSSYRDKSFYFSIKNHNFSFNEFRVFINKGTFPEIMDFVLSKGGVVFILLGDEDYKSSEIVAISHADMIEKIEKELVGKKSCE